MSAFAGRGGPAWPRRPTGPGWWDMGTKLVKTALVLLAGLLPLACLLSASAPAPALALGPSPRVTSHRDNLYARSRPQVTACQAAGLAKGSVINPLIESWNGARWSIMSTPRPAREAVQSVLLLRHRVHGGRVHNIG